MPSTHLGHGKRSKYFSLSCQVGEVEEQQITGVKLSNHAWMRGVWAPTRFNGPDRIQSWHDGGDLGYFLFPPLFFGVFFSAFFIFYNFFFWGGGWGGERMWELKRKKRELKHWHKLRALTPTSDPSFCCEKPAYLEWHMWSTGKERPFQCICTCGWPVVYPHMFAGLMNPRCLYI